MVILRTRNKITDFLMILAWASPFNSTLVKMIKCYIRNEQTNWDRNLGCLAAAYRSTPQESTNLTPNLLMLGREVR